MDWKIEVVTVPVSDLDRAIDFYAEKVGFNVDIDFRVSDEVRLVQMTPPGSACSIHLGLRTIDMEPGTSTACSWSSATCAPPTPIWERGAWTPARFRSSTMARTARPRKERTWTTSGASFSATLMATAGAYSRYPPAARLPKG